MSLGLATEESPDAPSARSAEPSALEQAVALAVAYRRATLTLLALLKDVAREAPEPSIAGYQQELDRHADALRSLANGAEVMRVQEEVRALGEAFWNAQKRFQKECDLKQQRMVAILTRGMDSLRSGNQGFHRNLITRFGEVEGLVRVPDLPTLRKSLTSQVSGLRTVVQDKDRQDSDQMASLQQEIQRLEGRLVEATVEAQTDPATGAHNRRALDAYLRELVAEAELGSQSFCVAMVDMDGLKAINDTHGHQIGDRAILALVQCLKAGIRQSDFLARYGGDEFALVLVGIGREPARAQAERLLRTLHQGSYSFQREGQDHKIGLRASLGLSFYRAGDTPETLLGRADRAVYQAKQAGKGRVCLEE